MKIATLNELYLYIGDAEEHLSQSVFYRVHVLLIWKLLEWVFQTQNTVDMCCVLCICNTVNKLWPICICSM
jgi:hypothetical protein